MRHKPKIDKAIDEIFYHITAWYVDEGEYQPTEYEVRDKVKDIINKIWKKKSPRKN